MEQLLSFSLGLDNLSHSIYQASRVHPISPLLAQLHRQLAFPTTTSEEATHSSSPLLVPHSFVRTVRHSTRDTKEALSKYQAPPLQSPVIIFIRYPRFTHFEFQAREGPRQLAYTDLRVMQWLPQPPPTPLQTHHLPGRQLPVTLVAHMHAPKVPHLTPRCPPSLTQELPLTWHPAHAPRSVGTDAPRRESAPMGTGSQ